MNKQRKSATSRGIEWTHVYGRAGYTANPVQGCEHDCMWEINGEIAECYAKTMAARIQKSSQVTGRGAYLAGFNKPTYHPKELQRLMNHKAPLGVFIDSMSDLLGHGIPPLWILESLQAMQQSPQHIYFLLTKNAPAYSKFGNYMPPNVWAGVSAPPQWMFGKRMDENQQARWFANALEHLVTVPVPVHWASIEPLSWNPAQAEQMLSTLGQYADGLELVVFGAASNGGKTFQPDKGVLREALDLLHGHSVPIFFKGNLSRELVASIGSDWLEQYPPESETLNPLHWQHWNESPAPAKLAQALAQAKEADNATQA